MQFILSVSAFCEQHDAPTVRPARDTHARWQEQRVVHQTADIRDDSKEEGDAQEVEEAKEAESFETARSRLRGIIESRDLTINQNEEDIRSLRNEVESLKMDLEDARAMKKTLLSGGGGGGSDSAQKLAQLQTRLSAKEKELKESQDEMDSIVSDLLSQKANLTLQVDKLTQENLDLKKNRKKWKKVDFNNSLVSCVCWRVSTLHKL